MKKLLGILVLFVLTIGLASAASITVTEPHAGLFWPKGKTATIYWNKEGTLPENVKITLRDENSTAELMVIADPAPNSGSYSWAIPANTANGKYVIRVKAKGLDIHGDSGVFNIHKYAKLTVTNPQGGETWMETTTHVITWTKEGNLSETVNIFLGRMVPYPFCVKVIDDHAPNSGSFTWTVPGDIPVGDYKLWILYRCTDYPLNWNEMREDVPFKLGLKKILIKEKK